MASYDYRVMPPTNPRDAQLHGGLKHGTPGRLLGAARAQLREAAGDALVGALEHLEAHVRERRTASRAVVRGPRERVREVLERDRALACAEVLRADPAPQAACTPAAANVCAEPPAPPRPDASVACDEPIRTRSMARLLAAQGYPDRALCIYAYLLARQPDDTALRAEAAALRAACAS